MDKASAPLYLYWLQPEIAGSSPATIAYFIS
jgi:hypothetical protein